MVSREKPICNSPPNPTKPYQTLLILQPDVVEADELQVFALNGVFALRCEVVGCRQRYQFIWFMTIIAPP